MNEIKVKRKQPNSKNCLVCGLDNPFSLKARYYELETKELVAIFKPHHNHQGYPGRVHGGIAAAILDETIGRAIMAFYKEEVWGVTLELNISYKKPIPIDQEIKVIGRITKQNSRIFEGTGEVVLNDGTIAVAAQGRYLKLPIDKITDFDRINENWKVIPENSDPELISIDQHD